jgi:hypothetical protein
VRRKTQAVTYHKMEKAPEREIPDLRAASGRPRSRAGNSYRDREEGERRHGAAFSEGGDG